MPAFITFGRILFAVLFLYSGATKLFGIAGHRGLYRRQGHHPGAAAALYGAARRR